VRLKLATCVALLALSGCVTDRQIKDSFRDRFQDLQGQPIQAAFDRLGYPTRQHQVAGEHVYVWSRRGAVTVIGAAGRSQNGDFTEAGALLCEIAIATDVDGVILRGTMQGSRGGCYLMMRRLPKT
jgi:hypothetical protein